MVETKEKKTYYYCCTYKVFNRDNKEIRNVVNDNCFSSLNYHNSPENKVVIYLKDNRTIEFNEKYTNFLNSFLKDLEYNKEDNTITVKYKSKAYMIAAYTCIRYLWEHGYGRFSEGDRSDLFDTIPDDAMMLFEKYNISEVTAILLAHYDIGSFNNGHSFLCSKTNVGQVDNEELYNALLSDTTNSLHAVVIKCMKNNVSYINHETKREQVIKDLNIKER